MATPNNGDEVPGAQGNNGEKVGGHQGSDSLQDTSSSSQQIGSEMSLSDPSSSSDASDPLPSGCSSIDRKARRAELKDPPYAPSDDETTSHSRNQKDEDSMDSATKLPENTTEGSRKQDKLVSAPNPPVNTSSRKQDLLVSTPKPCENTTEGSRKRKRGERGRNKWPDRVYAVSEVSPKGEPLQPPPVPAKFRNAIGFLVRDKLDITIPNWKQVTKQTKKDLWKKLKTRFSFPRESRSISKEYTMKQIAITFRNFRSELVTNFVAKELDATKKYKNITPAQWKTFVHQKTSPDFLALSKANSELSKKNLYAHHLGTGGYNGKIPKWRAEEEERQAAGLPKRFDNLDERCSYWLLARKPVETESGFSWTDPKTNEAAKRILDVAAKQKEGSFKPSREKDALTVGLGNPEHPGRVRGKSSRLGWKEGFPNDSDMYRKRDRYKEAMRDQYKAEAKLDFNNMLREAIHDPNSEVMQQILRVVAIQQAATMQPPQMPMVTAQPIDPCSIGTTALKEQFALDEIKAPTACSLVYISYGINTVRTKVVATGFVLPGRIYNNTPIPEQYCIVEVLTVVDGYRDDILEMTTPDGIKLLGEAINHSILWPQRDIRLDDAIQSTHSTLGPTCNELNTTHKVPLEQPSLTPKQPNPPPEHPNPALVEKHIPSPKPNPKSLPTVQSSKSGPRMEDATLEPTGNVKSGRKHKVLEMKRYMSEMVGLGPLSNAKEEGSNGASLTKITICKPSIEDYENVPGQYVLGRPLLSGSELSSSGRYMKMLHGWYMRAASAGITGFNVKVPAEFAVMGVPCKIQIDFDDIWLIFRLVRVNLHLMRLWCIIQIDDQEKRLAKDRGKQQLEIGYLDPFYISAEAHTVAASSLFEGKEMMSDDEKETLLAVEQKKREEEVFTYIGKAFLQYKDKNVVCAPYYFNGHWFCMFIYLLDGRVLVMDSLHSPMSSYKKFIEILNQAYTYYKNNSGPCNSSVSKNPLLDVTTLDEVCHLGGGGGRLIT